MTIILKAAPVREEALNTLQEKCTSLKEKGVTPFMKVLLVGENPASKIYTRNKKKFCEKFGAKCEILHLKENSTEQEFLDTLKSIVNDKKVHGCFVQLPLPSQLSHIDVATYIPTYKDVDGFTAGNLFKLFQGDKGEQALLPCTPKGIVTLFKYYDIPLTGKNVVIIGRSLIVGKPLATLLTNYNATVTLCHSKTVDLPSFTKKADIIISAIGKPFFLNKTFLGDNRPVIVDVGINHNSEGKLCGDVDFDAILDQVSAITPVPGGVGPMTILSLAQNLLQAAERSLYTIKS